MITEQAAREAAAIVKAATDHEETEARDNAWSLLAEWALQELDRRVAVSNSFLVTIGTRLDDLPIAIFPTYEQAVGLANMCESEDCVFHRTALELTRRDYAEPVCVAVSEFRDGLMISHEVVVTFDDLEEEYDEETGRKPPDEET